MALNITIDGYIYNNSGFLAGGVVNYQAFWWPNGTPSSDAKWNNVRISESSSYWNCNLGDSDMLGQSGVALNGGIVLVVFWIGGSDRTAGCGTITEWGAFEFELIGEAFYSNNVQTKSNILPTLGWSNNVPVHAYVHTLYSFYNSSTDIHYWLFGNVTMSHWYSRYGQTIFPINTIAETSFDWGDTTSTLSLVGAASYAHSWDTSGVYTVGMIVVDACGEEVSDTVEVAVYWAPPVPNIVRCDSIGTVLSNTIESPDTPIYFKYTGTNQDNTIVSITWSISDSGTYGNTNTSYLTSNVSDVVSHIEGLGTSWDDHPATPGAFTNPGSHLVTVTIVWNDGFQDQTVVYSESFTQLRFDNPPAPNIICNEAINNHIVTPSTVLSFNYYGTDPEDRITTIDWVIYDLGIYGNTDSVITNVLKTDTVLHSNGEGASWCGNETTVGAFTNPGNHSVSIVVTWNDGWDNNTINYSEVFIQDKFTGPSINFVQSPVNAITNQTVTFENTSTSIERVGLGLPSCEHFTWTWSDDDVLDFVYDVAMDYNLSKYPSSTKCYVELSAWWSDGWETNRASITKDVVFGTIVTVTPEDCYYVINVVGTSTDGTATGYGWTVSSGTSSSGVFSEVWSSPISEDQQNKTICFSATGWYNIEGTVYGTGAATSDYETLYINETCPDSGSTYVLWNGTGELDTGGDWTRDGFGYEDVVAKYHGTYGLLVAGATKKDSILLYRKAYTEVDISNYDFLSFWINIREWASVHDIKIRLYSTLATKSNYVDLSTYINFENLQTWQRIMIPLSRFSITRSMEQVGWPTYVNELEFVLTDGISFWVDNISLVMGLLVTVPVCSPNLNSSIINEQPGKLVPAPTALTPHPPNIHASEDIGELLPSIQFSPVIVPYPKPKDI